MEEAAAKILVVDDEDSIRNIIVRKLESDGYDCISASNGKDAVETASKQTFDLVLSDVKMPGMSGIELLSHIASDQPDTGVVMITAMADAQTAVEAMKLGAYDYITKPFDLDALGMKVEKALEKKRLIQENKDYRLKLSEQALKESKQQYSALVDNLADAVFTAQREIIWCNDQVEGIFGYKSDELIGKDVTYLFPEGSVSFEDIELVYEITDEGRHFRSTNKARKKDGRIIHVEFSLSRIPEKDPPEFVIVARDVTKRKEAEEALVELNRLKAEFVANVSHELRTPMQSIKGFTKLLLGEKVPDADTQKEFLSIIDKQTERLTEMIDDLLDVSRLESGQFSVHKEMLSIDAVIHDTIEGIGGIADEKGIVVKEDTRESLPEVEADGQRLKQVITNLLGNAMKFSETGTEITVSAKVKDNEIWVSVIDHGAGIPEEAIPRLFERFYQVDGSMTRQVGGSGLGLFICGQIIEAHSGRIWAESKMGEGSTFIFTIPMVVE